MKKDFSKDVQKDLANLDENTKKSREISSLVDAVKNNDTASFVLLLGHFSNSISALASTFHLPKSEYEDLCQEGRMALYRAAISYDGVSSSFATYANVCMTNAMISFSKKYLKDLTAKTANVAFDEDSSFVAMQSEDSQSKAVSDEFVHLLSTPGFACLSELERYVMRLKLSGFKVSEIAKVIGKESKSVENTLFRARKKLKTYINK